VAAKQSAGFTVPLGPLGVTIVVRRGVVAFAIGLRRWLR
jgi:hypothetical protein